MIIQRKFSSQIMVNSLMTQMLIIEFWSRNRNQKFERKLEINVRMTIRTVTTWQWWCDNGVNDNGGDISDDCNDNDGDNT